MKRITAIITSCLLLLAFVCNPWVIFAGNPPDQSKSTISGTYAPADGSSTSSVTIVLRDAAGNTLTSSDWILLTSSDSTVTLSPSSASLDGTGYLYTKMKSSHVGFIPITVNDTTTGTLITGSIYFYTPGGSPPSSSTCLDSPPGSTVQLTSAVSASDTSVTLNWVAASNPVTYYLVSYGLAAGNYIYGNPNVGGQGTTSYTVGGLTKGTTYYFAVRAGNGCTAGSYSNELSAVPGGATVTPTSTPTITTTITPTLTPTRAASTSATPTPTGKPTTTPNVTVAPSVISETPMPILTPMPTLVPDSSSQMKTILLVSTVLGVLFLIAAVVWLVIEQKKEVKPPPVIEY